MSSAAKLVPGDLLLSDLAYEKSTTTKLLLTYLICIHIHTQGYKIKSLTLLKWINFTKQTRVKLAGNAVPARRLDIVQYFNRIWSHWIFDSIRIGNFNDILFNSNEIADSSHHWVVYIILYKQLCHVLETPWTVACIGVMGHWCVLCCQADKEKRMHEGRAFQLLYLHLGLQLFTHQRETLDVLKVSSCDFWRFRSRLFNNIVTKFATI